jgi:hypothetical protein
MRWHALLVPLLCTSWCLQAEPLRIVAVLRVGLPPYEDEDRFYRLEGDGCETLRVGEVLGLQRFGDRRQLGVLKIVELHGHDALARLMKRGDTYPLKGDLVIRAEKPHPLPSMPTSESSAWSPAERLGPHRSLKPLQPPVVAAPALKPLIKPVVAEPAVLKPPPLVVHPVESRRQVLYFLKQDASLSPGAYAKLKLWVQEWGSDGQWIVAAPGGGDAVLSQERIRVIKEELLKLGVGALEVRPSPQETPGKYETVYVIREAR